MFAPGKEDLRERRERRHVLKIKAFLEMLTVIVFYKFSFFSIAEIFTVSQEAGDNALDYNPSKQKRTNFPIPASVVIFVQRVELCSVIIRLLLSFYYSALSALY